jgi:hypothetical protein
MKTTLLLPDPLFGELKRKAAREGRTLSGLVEEVLRKGLARPAPRRKLRPLPSFDTGRALVDVSDRDALDRATEGR